MTNPFFEQPVLNSPYEYPRRHWELDETGQPTQTIIERRRAPQFITPIPKPKKRKGSSSDQTNLLFGEGKDISTEKQQYEHTAVIDSLRQQVDRWRSIPDPNKPLGDRRRPLPHGSSSTVAGRRKEAFNETIERVFVDASMYTMRSVCETWAERGKERGVHGGRKAFRRMVDWLD